MFLRTLRQAAAESIRPALRTAGWLLAIMVPVSLAVVLLRYYGVLAYVAEPLEPLFAALGLPGEAALVVLTSIALNIYSAIAVIESLALSMRQVTILALMCLIAHNFFVEIPVVRRTGSRPLAMITVRLLGAVLGAVGLNILLPKAESAVGRAVATVEDHGLAVVLGDWAGDTLRLVVTVLTIIIALMIMTRILERYGVIDRVSRVLGPVLKVFGLPGDAAFLWVVANTLGLAYGAAVMIDRVEAGTIERSTADLLNHHLVISHSLLEDTLLFVALGVNAFWIVVPRVLLAAAAVWIRRIFPSRSVQSV